MVAFLALISVFIVSLVSFVGVFTLALNKQWLHRITFFLVAVATGAMFGGAFFHLLPEGLAAFEGSLVGPLAIMTGILIFFLIEKVLHWHHCHNGLCEESTKEHLAWMSLIGDGIHNFLDGVVIGTSFLVSIPVGVATTIAIIIHEIPQEISDFGVLLYGGFSVKKALVFNFLSGLIAMVGVTAVLLVGDRIQAVVPFILLFAAGGFVYVAGSDLIPEIHKEAEWKKSAVQFFGILLGMGIMIALKVWGGGV